MYLYSDRKSLHLEVKNWVSANNRFAQSAYEVDHGLLFNDTLNSGHFVLVFVGAFNGNMNPDLRWSLND
jgi:hypothetical protein